MEPKIFKTLVHKETGGYGAIFKFGLGYMITESGKGVPYMLFEEDDEIEALENMFSIDLSDYNLSKEIVLITREEYERLKGGAT